MGAYDEIVGINPEHYLNPDVEIAPQSMQYINEVKGWGRSVGHGRYSTQTTEEEMAALATFTGAAIPNTPAQAAGGRANQGGYYPNQPAQPAKGKGAGRSHPYSQSSSSASGSWWSSSWDKSWTGWSGWKWWD